MFNPMPNETGDISRPICLTFPDDAFLDVSNAVFRLPNDIYSGRKVGLQSKIYQNIRVRSVTNFIGWAS